MSDAELGIEGIGTASLIGQGGAGAVYRARQEAFNRTVAVKVLRDRSGDDADRRRFEDECRAVTSLSRHPHVLAVYASGTTSSGLPYRIMEYLPRGSLAQRRSREGRLDPGEVLELGIKLAWALDAAHRAGIVHGNLKPENVMVSAHGEPQLADFGLAPSGSAPAAGGAGMDIGPVHAAPEVFAGGAPDARADVYSLGSILCTLLTGPTPFQASDEESFHPLLDRVFVREVGDLRPPGVPQELWEVVERTLAKDPAQRSPTAAVLAGELESVKEVHGARAGGPAAPTAPLQTVPPAHPGVAPPPGPPSGQASGGRNPTAGSRVKIVGIAALLAPLALGALVLTRPDDRSQPTGLSASDVTVPTTVASRAPTSTEPVPRSSVPPVAPAEPPPSSPEQPAARPPEREIVAPPPPRPTPTTAVPRTTEPPPPITVLPPPPPPPAPETEKATVIGCDSFGQGCDDIPIYRDLPPAGTDPGDVATQATVREGTELRARCWSEGARTYNYDATAEPPDPGPDPYDSDVYFNVQVLGETWGWISDTTFVRDKGLKLGLPRC